RSFVAYPLDGLDPTKSTSLAPTAQSRLVPCPCFTSHVRAEARLFELAAKLLFTLLSMRSLILTFERLQLLVFLSCFLDARRRAKTTLRRVCKIQHLIQRELLLTWLISWNRLTLRAELADA